MKGFLKGLGKVALALVAIPVLLILVIGGCAAIERHFMTKDAEEFCDRFEIGTTIETVTDFVGAEKMEFAYINEEWGYRFRWWNMLDVGAEACSMWFEDDALVKKWRHSDLG